MKIMRERMGRALALLSCIFAAAFFGAPVFADTGLSVTLTPPLFQLTIGPSESWSSSLKIVNNNPYKVTYYAQVVDMEASGETGQSKFIPIVGAQDPALAAAQLARWIELEPGPITIPAGTAGHVHFTVRIPGNAEPGGHYAAILVGTQPLAPQGKGTQMSISSFVSSLLFVRVKGDVIETGRIREFTSDQSLYQSPKADFLLRFENTGNTHLKPAGDVVIYNMWGKERGKVAINQDANFGNVLPKTVRRFQFSWEGEENVFDIGRYSAVVTLGYGQDGQKNISATTYFWVVPIVPVASALSCIVGFFAILAWFIRRYIRRALEIERERTHSFDGQVSLPHHAPTLETLVTPLREGVVDLRALRNGAAEDVGAGALQGDSTLHEAARISGGQFVKKYRMFFVFVVVILVFVGAFWIYMEKVLVPARAYNIQKVISESEVIAQ